MSVRAKFANIYLRGMLDRSIRGGKELAREIQLTDWSTTQEQGKLVLFCRNSFYFLQREKSSFDRPKLRVN